MTQTVITRPTPIALAWAPTVGATLACPECCRLAEIVDTFSLASTDGPVEHFRLRCEAGRHHLTLLTEGHCMKA